MTSVLLHASVMPETITSTRLKNIWFIISHLW